MTLDDLQTFVARRLYPYRTYINVPGKYISRAVTKDEFLKIILSLDLYQCFKYYSIYRNDSYHDIKYYSEEENLNLDDDDIDAILYLIEDAHTKSKEIFYDTLKIYLLIDFTLTKTVSIF